MTLVLHGSFTESIPGDRRACEQYQVLLKPPGLRHACNGKNHALCLCLEVERDHLDELGPASGIWSSPAYNDVARLAPLVRRVHQELHDDDPASLLALEGLCMELTAGVYRCVRQRGERRPGWLDDVLRLFAERFTTKLRVADIAARVGLHRAHFSREFHRHVGCSPSEFIRRLRVERACELVQQGDVSLADIALAVGFHDQSHLTSVFRRVMGVPPGVYRSRLDRGRG